jgi:hypothetical protein
MRRRPVLVALLLLSGCRSHQGEPARFRYTLRDSGDWPAEVRRTRDSTAAAELRRFGCPSYADTLWTLDAATEIPRAWLDASVRPGCAHTALPFAVRRRLREDPAALAHYAGVVQRSIPAEEWSRAVAIRQLSWSAERRYLPLIIATAREAVPGVVANGDYNASYRATIELAPYVAESREARHLVWRAVTDSASELARQAGLLALTAANERWSRDALRRLARITTDPSTQAAVAHALARPPCRRGTIWVEWVGIEGQDFSRCEAPPDYR